MAFPLESPLITLPFFSIMRTYVFLALCLCLVGCDLGYPPVVINGYNESIEISLSFNGGKFLETKGLLPPNEEFVQRRKDLKIDKITVKEKSGKLHTYLSADLEKIRSSQKTEFEVWILTEAGLKLGDKEFLLELRRSKHL